MTKDGNLTVMFSYPVIVPDLFKFAVVDPIRLLSKFSIKDFVELYVISTFLDEKSDATEIIDYRLTRFTERAFDIQVIFKQPSQISQLITEPDRLGIRFKQNDQLIEIDTFVQKLDLDL